MNFWQVLTSALAAYLSAGVSVEIAGYRVTAQLSGTPVHLTFAAAVLAVEKIAAGATGTFQSGDISVTIAKVGAAPEVAAPPAAVTPGT